jgi:hypothetical protein
MTISGGAPPLQPPGSGENAQISSLTPKEQELFSIIKTVAPGVTQDQFLSEADTLQNLATEFGKDFAQILSNMQADEPKLPPAKPNAFSLLSKIGNAIKKAITGEDAGVKNKFFDSNASVAFAMAFQKFMREVSKLKLMEGILESKSTEKQWGLAKAIATNIMNSAFEEAKMHIASAGSAVIQGAASAVSAGFSFKSAAKMSGKTEKEVNEIQTKARAFSEATQAASYAAKAGEEGIKADATMAKGGADAGAEMGRTALDLERKYAEQRAADRQKNQELFDLFSQTMNDLMEKGVRASNIKG